MTFEVESFEPYFSDENSILFLADTFELLDKMPGESVDMIFADPPYFLSNDGISCSGGKAVSVNKGDWDKINSTEAKHNFNRQWIRLAKKVLKPNGTIWISGTLHNIYSVGMALEQEGFKILNNITWQKTNPPPNLSCRYFTHSTETILWARKNLKSAKHYFNYELMKELNDGKQMKDVWTGSLTSANEKTFGKHPTQKPLYLLKRIILASTREGDIVLDPFCGSATTGAACKLLNRKFIGVDNNLEFINLSKRRLENVKMNRKKIVAIDGPAGAGKSTTAKIAAEKLGYTYIDTGAMYRAAAWKVLQKNKPINENLIIETAKDIDVDLQYVDGVTKVFVDGQEITSEIRTPEVSHIVPEVAKIGFVREKLTELQRKMAARGGVLMDGRDIATHVLPNADVKIFLTASIDERAKRRFDELKSKGYTTLNFDEIKNEIALRDKQDMEREIAPLIQAEDATLLDTTGKSIDEVVNEILNLCK
ncbi:MAG: (d)CMP kinase [Selenomonadaceae bacterium]|nr:(d)CMP kinase [Selenomonadaceae bacterium]